MKRYIWRNRHDRPNVRIKGRVYPMRDPQGAWHEPDTPEGDKIYWEILRGKHAVKKRSWAVVISHFRKSDKWSALSQRSRSDLEPILQYIEDKLGDRGVNLLVKADIYRAMEKNKHRVRFANYLITAFSHLCKTAERLGWRNDNPALGMEQLKVPKSRKQPHIPWSDLAVERFRNEAQPKARLIFEIAVGSVQRPSDWCEFKWGDYDGSNLRLRQSKTNVPLVLPCTDHLKAALDAALAEWGASPHPSRHILTKADGSALPYRRMAQIMRDERERLHCTAHDQHALRYRGVMELAWAGCTDDEIASYSGHTSKAMIVKYAGEARQIMRARQAHKKRQ